MPIYAPSANGNLSSCSQHQTVLTCHVNTHTSVTTETPFQSAKTVLETTAAATRPPVLCVLRPASQQSSQPAFSASTQPINSTGAKKQAPQYKWPDNSDALQTKALAEGSHYIVTLYTDSQPADNYCRYNLRAWSSVHDIHW